MVVPHESFVARVYCLKSEGNKLTAAEDQKFNLFKITYQEIKQFDCGLKIHPRFVNQNKKPSNKPLLEEVLISCELYVKEKSLLLVSYIIEIKNAPCFIQ